MDSPLSTSTIESLPNDLLAAILKLVADSPIPSKRRIPPFPITFSSVSRRFRYLALASPELWTTIRLSHRSRCWKWAAIFLERSGSRPLDISINLEAYRILFTDRGYGFGYSSPIRIMKALAIVGPHIHRWRTLAIRLDRIERLDDLVSYILQSSFPATSKLESLHVSVARGMPEAENRLITIPEDWEAPLFPTLHTFGSQEITTLHLIHTSGNEHLLTPVRQDGGWPSLSSLTVETEDDPSWLPPFLAARSGISTLTISPALLPIAQSITSSLGPNSTLNLRILSDGPSPSFAEFASPAHTCRFYYDDDHLGISDFEYTEVPFFISSRSFIHPAYGMGMDTARIGTNSRKIRKSRRIGMRGISVE
ncbi:hypothetical protein R3P38DRAFT_3298648 [Favolaschia claudopus]|uniref:F-box domain-containing protein n=1 Tax=Favolaschia claudopus TaxID=2862362 RepID=A0AAV9Z2W4_9AGAR